MRNTAKRYLGTAKQPWQFQTTSENWRCMQFGCPHSPATNYTPMNTVGAAEQVHKGHKLRNEYKSTEAHSIWFLLGAHGEEITYLVSACTRVEVLIRDVQRLQAQRALIVLLRIRVHHFGGLYNAEP